MPGALGVRMVGLMVSHARVVDEKGKPHRSGLEGGYWSWVRGRRRPLADGHAEDVRYDQIGFRCCADGPLLGRSD